MTAAVNRFGLADRQAVRAAGLAYARRWRERQPARELLDALYSPKPRPAGEFPFRNHRTCAEWS